VSLHFQLELKCPHGKKCKGLRSGEGGVYTSKSKCLRTYICRKFFPCSVVGNALLMFVEAFWIHFVQRNGKMNNKVAEGRSQWHAFLNTIVKILVLFEQIHS
jgi:hypothetical protein